MNCYLVESIDNQKAHIQNFLSLIHKSKIDGQNYEVQRSTQQQYRFPALPDNCNTVVFVGTDKFLEAGLWHYRDFMSAAFGYLAYDFQSSVAKDMQLNSPEVAVKAIKNRKVITYQPLQTNHGFVLFKLELDFGTTPQKVQLHLDQKLQLQTEINRLVVVYHPDHPFAHTDQFEIEGYAIDHNKSNQDNPLKLPFPLVKAKQQQLLARLAASYTTIQAAQKDIVATSQAHYKLPLRITISKQKLRLIAPREELKRLHG